MDKYRRKQKTGMRMRVKVSARKKKKGGILRICVKASVGGKPNLCPQHPNPNNENCLGRVSVLAMSRISILDGCGPGQSVENKVEDRKQREGIDDLGDNDDMGQD